MIAAAAILLALSVAVLMEGVAWATHKHVMFHKRVRGLRLKPWTFYLKRIVRAHADRHQSFGKGQARSFGFLYAPRRFDVRNA